LRNASARSLRFSCLSHIFMYSLLSFCAQYVVVVGPHSTCMFSV
jgi:hypothetical protein